MERAWLPPGGPYQSLALGLFIDAMQEALSRVESSVRFLEVGCGIGTKMLLAEAIDSRVEAWGIENHHPYVEKALSPRVLEAEATNWDGYGRFDLIYCYRLFIDYPRECALEARIRDEMKTGAQLLCFGVGPRLWLKV